MIYLDAGTTYSKIITIDETFDSKYLVQRASLNLTVYNNTFVAPND